MHSRRNVDSRACSHSDADGGSHSNAYANAYPSTHGDPHSNAYANAYPDPHLDSQFGPCTDVDAYPRADRNAVRLPAG